MAHKSLSKFNTRLGHATNKVNVYSGWLPVLHVNVKQVWYDNDENTDEDDYVSVC